jgi:hypothetical protein
VDPGGGHVAALIAGPDAARPDADPRRRGSLLGLRLIEDEWRLLRLLGAGEWATPSIEVWRAAA